MIVCSPIRTCAKNVVHFSGRMGSCLYRVVCQGPSSSCCISVYPGHSKIKYTDLSASSTVACSSVIGFKAFSGRGCIGSCSSGQRGNLQELTVKGSSGLKISLASQNMKIRLLMPKQGARKIKCNVRSMWPRASAGLGFGLFICSSSSEPVYAEAGEEEGKKEDHCHSSHGKKVYTDYSVIGIPGDGRCLFRSVAHGACLRSGRPAPNDHRQRQLADELRAKVADEFVKRRKDTEWFVEGDFDTYVSQIREPQVWGGEPELLMASHVLGMPITVYMYDKDAGGLITIAEYGEEYGKENPVRVLYNGYSHYDALQIPGRNHGKSKL
ncbi:hypothetical protein SLE2022_137760 [Rubroshorea leprosula]